MKIPTQCNRAAATIVRSDRSARKKRRHTPAACRSALASFGHAQMPSPAEDRAQQGLDVVGDYISRPSKSGAIFPGAHRAAPPRRLVLLVVGVIFL